MLIEEHKETVLNELEKAVDSDEIGQIINRSIERFPENDLFRYLVIIYLHILQNELQRDSELHLDTSRKRNLRNALNYLRQMRTNRDKVE